MGLPRWYTGKRIQLPIQEIHETWVQSLGQEDLLEEEMATCLEYSMGRGAWQATVHGIAKSRTLLNNWAHTHMWVYLWRQSFNLLFIIKSCWQKNLHIPDLFIWGLSSYPLTAQNLYRCHYCRVLPEIKQHRSKCTSKALIWHKHLFCLT